MREALPKIPKQLRVFILVHGVICMRWFFRATGLIFVLFLILMIVGYFTSPVMVVEENVSIEATSEDVFPYLEDLELSSQWAPWANTDVDFVYGGNTLGVGATMMWREGGLEDTAISSEEIISAQIPEFVQSKLLLSGEVASATYALLPSEGGDSVGVYITFEKDIGGFPYLQRVLKRQEKTRMSKQLGSALLRLRTIIESS